MENKEKSSRRFGGSDWIVVAGILIIVLVLILVDVHHLGSMQSIVVIISSVSAAVVTYLLLRGQSHDLEVQRKQDKEEERQRREEYTSHLEKLRDQARSWEEKRFDQLNQWRNDRDYRQESKREWERNRYIKDRLFANKIAAFSSFNEIVWQFNLDSPKDRTTAILNIRKELFGKVVFYLLPDEINRIASIVSNQNQSLPFVLSGIMSILNQNAENTLAGMARDCDKSADYESCCKQIWEAFNLILNSSTEALRDS